MEVREISGKTVEEAIEVALKELDARREEAEVEILSQGKPGFLGIRSEPARVRVRKLTGPRNVASIALEALNKILASAGVQTYTTIRSAFDDQTGGPVIDITGDDAGLLIGRRGETLRALQFLVSLVIRKENESEGVRITLDVERYRERRHNALKTLAVKVAEKVASTGRSVSLEPMPASDRRIIHLSLAEHPKVSTESSGMGETRKVTIKPKTE
jgi:spoIIIJ-associated protein